MINAIVVGVLVAATLIWFYFSPIAGGIVEFLVIFIPNIMDFWPQFFILVSMVLIAVLAWSAFVTHSWKPVLFVVFFWIVVFGYYILPPVLKIVAGIDMGEQWKTALCMISMEDMQSCLGGGGDEPDVDKIGSYKVLRGSIDTTYTGGEIYRIAGVLSFETYYIDVEFTNPSNTETIENFFIRSCTAKNNCQGSYLKRGGSLRTVEKYILASLTTPDGMYMDGVCPAGDCSIGPRETLRLSLRAVQFDHCDGGDEQSCENVDFCVWTEDGCKFDQDFLTSEVEARVVYEYEYSAEGQWEFLVAESDDLLTPLLNKREDPKSSAGPLDIKVYFTPTSYVFRDPAAQSTEIGAIVKLINEDEGSKMRIQDPIEVSRLTNGGMSHMGTCGSPWDPALPYQTVRPLVDAIQLGGEQSLRQSHTYICKYTVDRPADGDETVPFFARVNYVHEKTMVRSHIMVSEELP